jgi:ribosomal small subunit protein bTHX
VGKGDRRTRRGKIYAGSFGKMRPKDPKRATKTAAPAATRSTAKPAAKTARRPSK